MAHDESRRAQRAANAATTLRQLLTTAGIDTPDGLDFDALIEPGDAIAQLISHIVDGHTWPASNYHEPLAYDLADRLGTRSTLDAIVAAAPAIGDVGNVAGELVANGYAGSWEQIVEQLPVDLNERYAASILNEVCCPVSGILRVAQRCGYRIDWVIGLLDDTYNATSLSATTLDEAAINAVLAVTGDVNVILSSSSRWATWIGPEEASKLLRGSRRQAALAVVGGAASFDDTHDMQLLDRLDDVGFAVIVAARWHTPTGYTQTKTGHEMIRAVVERAFREPWLAKQLSYDALSDVISAATDRHWCEGDAASIAAILRATTTTRWYLARSYHRADVCARLVIDGDLTAEMYTDAVTLSRIPVKRDVAETIRGLGPAFIDQLATRADGNNQRTAELAGVINAIVADHGAALPGAAARLWRALLDQRPDSPAADVTLTLGEMCSTYMTRWTAEAARKQTR